MAGSAAVPVGSTLQLCEVSCTMLAVTLDEGTVMCNCLAAMPISMFMMTALLPLLVQCHLLKRKWADLV
jgi:hypothetical protein